LVKNLQVYSIDSSINKRAVHSLVASLKAELNFNISSLFINFITSKELLKINKEHLKHYYPTDVISFNYSNGNGLDGEILISVDDAKTNAKKYKVSYSNELNRLVIHGILHLLGHNDIRPKEKNLMKEMEQKLLYKNKIVLLADR
jgi:rRNA maturation RNase YbeY